MTCDDRDHVVHDKDDELFRCCPIVVLSLDPAPSSGIIPCGLGEKRTHRKKKEEMNETLIVK